MIVNIIVYLLLLVGLIASKSYEKNFFSSLDHKEHNLFFFYPLSLFLVTHLPILKNSNQNPKREDALRALNVTSDIKTVNRLYITKKMSVVLLIIIGFNTISLFGFLSAKEEPMLTGGNSIRRPGIGEEVAEVDIDVAIEDGEDFIEHDISLEIDPKHYNSENKEEMLKKAQGYIDKYLLGDNQSFDNIHKPLNLISSIPDTGFSVKWDLDNYDIIGKNGTLNNVNIDKNGVLTSITAKLEYYETKYDYSIPLKIMPSTLSEEEQVLSTLDALLKKAEGDTLTQDELTLPDKIGDRTLLYSEKKKQSPAIYLVVGIILAGIAAFFMDQDLEKKLQKREVELLIDYPEIINKFSLLLGAGMTMKNAWGKIVSEYNGKAKTNKQAKRFAYDEMSITWNEMMNGVTEVKAFENFGRRLKLLPYLKFSSLLSQNVKKGMKGLLDLLEIEALDAFEDRKELAKRLGEEAGTKLLGPMMIMLLIVLFIIMVPAFTSM